MPSVPLGGAAPGSANFVDNAKPAFPSGFVLSEQTESTTEGIAQTLARHWARVKRGSPTSDTVGMAKEEATKVTRHTYIGNSVSIAWGL